MVPAPRLIGPDSQAYVRTQCLDRTSAGPTHVGSLLRPRQSRKTRHSDEDFPADAEIQSSSTSSCFARRVKLGDEALHPLQCQKPLFMRFAKVLANERTVDIDLVPLDDRIGTQIELREFSRS